MTRIVYQKTLLEMMQAGYLVDLRAIQVLLQADFDALRTQQGDFVEAELETPAARRQCPGAGARGLSGARRRPQSPALYPHRGDWPMPWRRPSATAGIAAEALDGTTPLATRRAILQRLHTGDTRVVANCAVLTEGFDEPSVDCIIVARPTQSAPALSADARPRHPDLSRQDRLSAPRCRGGQHPAHAAHRRHPALAVTPARAGPAVGAGDPGPARRARPRTRTPITGTLRSTPVDLFARRALRWVQTRQGAWVLSLGAQHGTLRLRPDGPETWQVVQVRRDAEPVLLGDTLPLPYAQGLAEDYARHLGVARLVEAEAPWRQQPATEKQTALLRKLGLAVRAGLTKGEAADLLAAVLGTGGNRSPARLWPGRPTQRAPRRRPPPLPHGVRQRAPPPGRTAATIPLAAEQPHAHCGHSPHTPTGCAAATRYAGGAASLPGGTCSDAAAGLAKPRIRQQLRARAGGFLHITATICHLWAPASGSWQISMLDTPAGVPIYSGHAVSAEWHWTSPLGSKSPIPSGRVVGLSTRCAPQCALCLAASTVRPHR